MKKLTALILTLALCIGILPAGTASAAEPEPLSENLSWDFSGGTLTISGEGEMNDFITHMSLPTPWGQHYDKIKSVVIEDGVTSIGEGAFFAQGNIVSVVIPASVTRIGSNAFTYCFDLTDIYYTGTAEQWSQIAIGEGDESFSSATVHYGYTPQTSGTCGEALAWNFDAASGTLTISGEGMMDDFDAVPWYEYSASITSVVIEDGVLSVGAGAFTNHDAITALDIADSVIRIGADAFALCSGITSAVLPENLLELGDGAFAECASLESVTLSTALSTIGANAFAYCTALADVYYAGTAENRMNIQIEEGNEPFADATLHYVGGGISDGTYDRWVDWTYYPETDTTVFRGNGATSNVANPMWAGLNLGDDPETVIITDGITRIGYRSLAYQNYKRIFLADSVLTIGWSAFAYCHNLDRVVLPKNLLVLGGGAFDQCSSLTTVFLPASLESINNYTFAATPLTDVYYEGSAEQWAALEIGEHNEELAAATIHFDSTPDMVHDIYRIGGDANFFYDVSEDAWYCDTVYAAADAGLVAGNADGTFAPNDGLTWAQTVTFAARIAQYNAGEQVYTAADQTEIWYQIYVDYALERGIITAVPADPNAPITRGDAAVIFAAALGDAADCNTVPDGYFTDVAADSAACDAIYTLTRAGIVNGLIDAETGVVTFGVDAGFKRSEVATIVARMADLVPKALIE